MAELGDPFSELAELFRPITEIDPVPKDPDNLTSLEKLDAENQRLQNASYRQDMEERKKYADRIFRLIVWWLISVLVLVVLAALNIVIALDQWGISFNASFDLSDTVLVTLITTTTANVLGIFVFVVRYLYKTP